MNWESVLDRVTGSFFGLICHQIPTELLYIDGKAVTLCPRCIGLQIGFLIAFALVVVMKRRARSSPVSASTLLVTVAFAMLVPSHWTLCRIGIIVPDSTMRLASGLGSGAALAILLNVYLAGKSGQASAERPAMSVLPVLAVIAAAGLTGAALVSSTSWLTVTLVMSVCVLSNSLIAVHTLRIIALGIIDPKSKTIANGG